MNLEGGCVQEATARIEHATSVFTAYKKPVYLQNLQQADESQSV